MARYNDAESFIDAYYVDWDILSLFQDNFTAPGINPPSALGDRMKIDGPYDTEMAISTILESAVGSLFFALQSHLSDTVIYSLLNKDGMDISGYDLD
jgi:hypothetical protein